MISYQTILTLVSIGLGVRYLVDAEASIAGRAVVGLIVVGSLLVPDGLAWQIVRIVAQLATSLFVLFRFKLTA